MHEIESESSGKIRTSISFDSDDWWPPIMYWDAWNLKQNILANSNGHIFWLECPIAANNVSRRVKFKTEDLGKSERLYLDSDVQLPPIMYWDAWDWKLNLWKIQTSISFDSDGWLSSKIYWDTWNWKWNLWANLNVHIFSLECMIDARNVSRRLIFKAETLGKFECPFHLTWMSDGLP